MALGRIGWRGRNARRFYIPQEQGTEVRSPRQRDKPRRRIPRPHASPYAIINNVVHLAMPGALLGR